MQQGFSPFLRLPQDHVYEGQQQRSVPLSYFRVEFFKYAKVETMVFLGAFVLASVACHRREPCHLGTIVHAPASVSWPLRQLPTAKVTTSCPSLPELQGLTHAYIGPQCALEE